MSKNSSISNEKSKRRRYDLRGLRTAAIAFVIMALADFSLHAMRMFFKNSMIELAYIGVITIAWLIMLMGTRKIADYNGDFKRAYGATIPAIFACLAWLIIAIVELQRGVGKQTFSSLGIMLMGYIVMLCMLYCYAHLLNGSSVVLDGFRKEKLQKSCRRIWKVSMLLIIIAVLCEQGAPLFPEQIKYMITISAAVVSLIVQMLMIKNLLVVYDIVDGKLEPRRLKDVLDGIKEEDAKEAKAEPENNEGKVAKEAVDEDVAPEIADNEEASEEPIEESDEEPQEEEVGESSEELKDEEAEESTEELAGESVEEMGDEKIDEAPDESDEEPQEEELGESPEELTDETDDESDEEPADESVDELVEEVRDEQADEPAEESVEEMQDEQADETIEEMQDEPAEKPTGKLTEDKTIDLREILTVVTAKDNNDNSIEENFEEPEAESGFEAPEEPEDEEPSVDDIRFEDEETDAGEIEESEPEELKDEEQSSEDIQFEDEKEEIEKETEEPEDEEPNIDDIRFEDEVTDAGEIEEPEIEAQEILEDEESESEELKLEDIVFDNEEDDKWKTEELELNEITGQESAEPEEIPEQVQPEEPEDDKITELRNRIAEIRIIEKGLTDPIDRLNAAAERIELEKELRKEIENE